MKISVIGAGYVGLSSSLCLAEMGHEVLQIDIDLQKVDAINSGRSPLIEPGFEDMLCRHSGHRLKATADYASISSTEVCIICVDTPSSQKGEPDLSRIKAACRSIGYNLRNSHGSHLIVVKSTVPPGTTQCLIRPSVLEASCDNPNIGFAVNPEFLREGQALKDFMNPDRIVIGCWDPKAADMLVKVYNGIKSPIIRTDPMTAEMIKYASNAFLATKISFSNEIGNICKRLGLDVYEVMRGVGLDHRISPYALDAGIGFGGSCLPKDLRSLIYLAKNLGENPRLLKSVEEVNNLQSDRIIKLLEKRLGDLKEKRIAILGIAFKGGTDEVRDSRAIPVIKELLGRDAFVAAYDPLALKNMNFLTGDMDHLEYCSSAAEALQDADACLVLADCPIFEDLDREFDLMRSKIIIEGRRILEFSEKEGICW
jgi:UDPglucose 6-dehydrogenase